MNPSRRLVASRFGFRKARGEKRSRERLASAWRRKLAVERLEERAMLAQVVDLGGLRFSNDEFTVVGNDYSASGATELGLTPAAGETFKPLISVLGSIEFTIGTADPSFSVDGTLDSVVQSTPSGIPLCKGMATFATDDLLGAGASLMQAMTFQVQGTNFTPTLLAFANPGGGTTDDALLQLQGALTFDEIDGLTVQVGGSDFVTIDEGGADLTDLQQVISPTDTLTLFELSMAPDELHLSYSSSQGVFGIYGTLDASTSDQAIVDTHLQLGSADNPGVVVQDGIVTQAQFEVRDGIEIWDLSLEGSGLTWEYDRGLNRYEVYGDTSLSGYVVDFDGSLGDSSAPGVTISGANGEVASFRMDVDDNVVFGPLTLDVQNVVFQYDQSDDEYELSGTLSIPELFDATVNLGTSSQPAVVFKEGQFQLDNLKFSLSDVYLGAFVVDDLVLNLSYDSPDWSFEVDAVVWFPANFAVQAEVGFDNGVLNTIGFGASGLNIEIGDTGLVLKQIAGELKNFDHPSDIVISGSLTVAWGDSMEAFPTPFGNRDVALFGAKGSFIVDKDELYLEGDIYAGMLLDPVTGESTGVIGEGSGELFLDWGDDIYQFTLQVDGYWDTFEIKGEISISGGDEIFFLAEADVKVPDFIPFIHGRTLADVGFALKYHSHDDQHPYSDDFVAGWVSVDLFFFTAEVGVKVNFDGDVSAIGHHQIDSFEHGSRDQPQNYQYYASFVVPEGATSGMFEVDWGEAVGNQSIAVKLPDGTTIDQSQFSTVTKIGLVPALSTETARTAHVVGSATDQDQPLPSGNYQLILTSDTKFSNTPTFRSGVFYPKPTLALGVLEPDTTSGTVNIPVTATVDDAFESVTTVSFFYDFDGTGYDGTPIAGLQNVPKSSMGATVPWNLSSELPVPHYVYAVINDGTNVPVTSAYSDPITPQPPVSGQVSDVKHGGQAVSGLTVYLDLNHNGQFDHDTDPSTTTGSAGFYSFYDITPNTPYSLALVVPSGYQMDPDSPTSNPETITWDGEDQVDADFSLDLLAAIRGTVYLDSHQNGSRDPDAKALSEWTVYLDANNNGKRDSNEIKTVTDSSGRYTFYNVALNATHTIAVEQRPDWFQTSPTPAPGTRTVTMGNDPFKLFADQDFSVYPFLTISGTIAGYELNGGRLDPKTTPLEGWTVVLSKDGEVVASTGTLADGSYGFTGTLLPGTYTVSQVIPPGWREVDPFTSDLQLWRHDTMHLPGGSPQPNTVAAADFDGNGWVDFAVLDPANEVGWLYKNNDGKIATIPNSIELPDADAMIKAVAGDFAGTGTPELAVLYDTYTVTTSTTEWVLPAELFQSEGEYIDLVHGSFGGGVNLAALYSDGNEFAIVTLLPNGGVNLAATGVGTPGNLATGDVNGDGLVDFVVGNQNGNPTIFFGDGNGGISSLQTVPALPGGQTVVAGDINSDGIVDVGVFDSAGMFHYALQTSTGGFSAPFSFPLGSEHSIPSVVLEDVNGDLRPDLVWVAEHPDRQFYALFAAINTADPSGWFTAQQLTNWSLAPNGIGEMAMVLADLDNDGLPEMIVTDATTGNVTVVHNDSTTVPTVITVQMDGKNYTDANFTNAEIGQINGRAFDDTTGDGAALPGKPARAGVTVYVDLNRNGHLDGGEPTSITGPHGLYAFDSLAEGTYEIHAVAEAGRRLTTPAAGFHEVTVSASAGPVFDQHFGSVVSIDLLLSIPETADDWTIRRNEDRLEIVDDSLGVIASELLNELNSVTIVGTGDRRSDRLTLDLASGGFFKLPGGITFEAGLGRLDALRFLLGDGDSSVMIEDRQALVDAGLVVDWNGLERLEIDARGGDDRLDLRGIPVDGRINLEGGWGNDVYALALGGRDVWISDSGGIDTLDFSQAGAGVRVDLGRRGPQRIDAFENVIRLDGLFENATGSPFADVLIGDEGDNLLRGGAGDDELLGKRGNDILLGEAGYDFLSGDRGRDLLIGGSDADALCGEEDDDILIAGLTAFDGQNTALEALLAEWTSHRDFDARVRNLTDGTGGGDLANGEYFLTNDTVFNDFVPDTLLGGPGRNWFLVAANDWELDQPAATTSIESAGLFGDYNRDGVVDASDYTVWRDQLNTLVVPFSGADGNADGRVDNDDYVVWKANFGNSEAGKQLEGAFASFANLEQPVHESESRDRVRGMAALTPANSSIEAAIFDREEDFPLRGTVDLPFLVPPRATWQSFQAIDEALTARVGIERKSEERILPTTTLALLGAARANIAPLDLAGVKNSVREQGPDRSIFETMEAFWDLVAEDEWKLRPQVL